jgi:hypothetical protein
MFHKWGYFKPFLSTASIRKKDNTNDFKVSNKMHENDVGYQYFVPKLQNKYRSEFGALCYFSILYRNQRTNIKYLLVQFWYVTS